MVERIGLAIVVVVGVMALLYVVPRKLGESATDEDSGGAEAGWPDVMARGEAIAESWTERPRVWDAGLGVVSLVLLGVSVFVYLDPALLGGLAAQVEFVVFPIAALGLGGLFAATYLNTRRSGLYSAEATMIGMSLLGVVLLLLVVAMLLQ